MALTFESLIQHNKRTSLWLVLGIVLFLSLLCGVFGVALSGGSNNIFAWEIFASAALIGCALAIFGSLFSYVFGAGIVSLISDAYRVEPHEDRVLFNVVEEISIAAGIPPPKIYVMYDESPNAFATGRDPSHALVAITTGLRSKLNRDELQAVIAHEIAHIKNYDILLMMMVGVYAGMIVLLSDFFMRSFGELLRFGGGKRSAQNTAAPSHGAVYGLIISIGFIIVALLLAWLAPLIARFLQLAVSREREYLADATAVKLCRNPTALVSALKKIALDPAPLRRDNRAIEHLFIVNPNPKMRLNSPNLDSIWSTHPPLIKRIARLNTLARNIDLGLAQ